MFEKVNVTGFQAFGTVDVNPTELVVNSLIEKPHPKLGDARKLNVTVKAVDEYVQEMCVKAKETKTKTINLHFGVGPNTVYFLETCAYNNKDFRIPDNDGHQCKNQKICEHLPLDEALKTEIDLEYLANQLKNKHGHQVQLSTDPGRYLCNYIYYCSLQKLRQQQKESGENCQSLFVHFPSLQITTHEQNVKFAHDLIDLLTE